MAGTDRFVFTPGEPAGVGPDIAVKLAQNSLACELVYIANQDLLETRAKLLNLKIKINSFNFNQPPRPNKKYEIKLIEKKLEEVKPGVLDSRNSAYVLSCLEDAAAYCLKNNFAGLITGPVHKGIINEAGFAFSGHTEHLQKLSESKKVVMLLANNKLKVALATTHLPLKDVSKAISEKKLIATIKILHSSLQNDFGIKNPKIIVSGLNPHAGENGYLGQEEIKIIIPAIKACQGQNMDITGPLAADTMFNQQNLKIADAFLAMYHDQGLPILKYSGFGDSVNITLGLPFIRTSVDHGTALELAGTGKASDKSLKQALTQAMLIRKNHA